MRGTWDDLNRRLTGALLALDLNHSLLIEERVEKPAKKGLFGKRAEPAVPHRFVQITAGQSVLIGECVGSTSFGGEWEMSEEAEATLLRQGWEKPWSEEFRTFTREAPLVGAPRLALATVLALQVLGCEMDTLEVRLINEDP